MSVAIEYDRKVLESIKSSNAASESHMADWF